MNFIQKRIQQKKLEKEEQLKREYSFSMLSVEKYIPLIKKEAMGLVSHDKATTSEQIDDFIFLLERFEDYYNRFLYALKESEYVYKNTYNKKIAESEKKKAEFMHKVKKQYRKAFETIYDTFKRVSKGCELPRRNEVLGKLRSVFDFDSTKYYAPDRFIIMH